MLARRNKFLLSSFISKMSENVKRQTQMANRVQQNALNQVYSIQNQAKLRQKVDLQSSVQSLQKQMRKQIAQALKRSEGKVQYLLEKAVKRHTEHLKTPLNKLQIKQYNSLVKACQTARWQYLVHRHSCGFTIRNYEIVTEMFKIPPAISEQ